MALIGVPWWGRAVLQRLDFFHLRSVLVEGTRYLDPATVVQQLEVDTLRSIWDELAPVEAHLRELPLVADVRLGRRLPGTLVVQVKERVPVAFVASGSALQVLDDGGHVLPIDPRLHAVDLPILAAPDTSLLRLLGELRLVDPTLYRRVSDIRRVDGQELLIRMNSLVVRAAPDVSARRLADIKPVEADLRRRNERTGELDLRFRDQVIARLP